MEEQKEVKTTKKTTTKKPTAKKTNTAKKSTVKKTAVKKAEEKKVEVSYCGNCGKNINAGEVCDCVKKVEPVISIDKDVLAEKSEAIVEKSKGILETIISVYKEPYNACKSEMNKGDIKNSFLILSLIALSMGIIITALTYASFHTNVGTLGTVSDYYRVSYLRIFIVWSLISFMMAFLPIIISYLASSMFSKVKFSFNNSINLCATCLSVTIVVNLISAVFIFAGLFVKFFLLMSFLAWTFGLINYIFIYRDIVNFEKAKEPYIFLGIILCFVLGIAVVASLFTSGIGGLNAFETIISTINK